MAQQVGEGDRPSRVHTARMEVIDSVGEKLFPGTQTEFAHQATGIRSNRALIDGEAVGNLCVEQSMPQQKKHIRFPLA